MYLRGMFPTTSKGRDRYMYTFATFFPGFGLMIQRSRASIWLQLKEFPLSPVLALAVVRDLAEPI